MITAFNNEDSTEHTSKMARLVSPDIENAVQSDRDSTKTRLKAHGPRYGPVLRPEGFSDF
jgi:hypothetical protein